MPPSDSPVPAGLSEGEVLQRRAAGQGNDVVLTTGRTYGQIVRENLFTFFNIVLFSLAGVLLILGSPRDAFFTGAIALLNSAVATAQEMRAKRKLDRITLLTRPKATVLRDGHEQRVDPSEVVLGDILIMGPGDQAVVDGTVVGKGRADVDESLLTGESDLASKQAGDPILSGSYVVTGRLAYEAQKLGADSFANKLVASARASKREITPLQREVNLVIRILLVLVVFFGALIALNYFVNDQPSLLESVRAASVVFGLAPSSLFLTIVVAYALGAVRIADKGALVQQSNAVESLCHVDVLCLDKTGTLTANRIKLNRQSAIGPLDEDELSQALGVYAASGSAANRTSEAIAAAYYPVATQPVHEEVPFSSARKWSALSFDGPGVVGTYVLGAPEMLFDSLVEATVDWRPIAGSWAGQGQRVLMFAYRPRITPLYHDDGEPQLPGHLIPLGLLGFSDELRPDARETLEGFRQAGITLKIISGDSPVTVAALAEQAGLSENGLPLHGTSGQELATMDETDFARTAAEATIFGRITPEQKQRLVQTLRDQGHYVAMTGDGVNDVLALKQAKLAIAMQSGTPATRGVADIVLLDDSFAALPEAFLEGQRIMNGMGDILRLYLTRSLSLALVIATVAMLAAGFPYSPAQNSVIAIFILAIPAFALALWARPGPVPHTGIIRQLVNFVLPATLLTALFLIVVYLVFMIRSGDWPYTQLALTYATITTGLLLIVFVEPPTDFWAGGDRLAGDWRPTGLATGLFVLLLASPYLPILSGFFGLAPLRTPLEYALILGLTLVWMLVLRFTWKAKLLDRYLDLPLA